MRKLPLNQWQQDWAGSNWEKLFTAARRGELALLGELSREVNENLDFKNYDLCLKIVGKM